ncbi:cation diffusion facilitator family transporter [Anaerobranca gottschalkii]|uniref:Cation diffusion facilitator family transporter n=1 Tax=Anaerobranca gottschalkii DSM 13577 TaxID=1120990 RepID=A0A1I0B8V8_9FIRM|nr:cation diffusion facilitator family transporter [Anaerobranca gottschalkii]SET03299.1 cation diffusion facilitator family transporter [Anaerobranca gottschalkii DSM 13577]
MTCKQQDDQRLLLISTITAIMFAVTGIVWGLIISSQMILFDGLYSLISVVLSLLSLYSVSYMNKKDWHKYPFGKEMIQPLVIIVKYSVILILVLASLIAAIFSLLTGGRETLLSSALAYTIFASFVCYAIYFWLKRKEAKGTSSLITAEKNQWMMDTYISFGVLGGFALAKGMSQIDSLVKFVPYADPTMVIIASILCIKLPFIAIKDSINQLLGKKPEHPLVEPIQNKVKEIEKKYLIEESYVRIAKVGEQLWIEIDFVVTKDSLVKTIDDQDQIREEIARVVKNTPHWLTVSFTGNRKWAI